MGVVTDRDRSGLFTIQIDLYIVPPLNCLEQIQILRPFITYPTRD